MALQCFEFKKNIKSLLTCIVFALVWTVSKRRHSPEGKPVTTETAQTTHGLEFSHVFTNMLIFCRWQFGFQCADMSKRAGAYPQNQTDRGRTFIFMIHVYIFFIHLPIILTATDASKTLPLERLHRKRSHDAHFRFPLTV